MIFGSSILQSKHADNENIYSIAELARTSDDNLYIYSLLEFNDSVHDIDVFNKITYYRFLLEHSDDDMLTENVIGDAVKFISSILEKLIGFLSSIGRKIMGIKSFGKLKYKNYSKQQASRVNNSSELWRNNEEHEINIYCYPDISKIDSVKVKACLTGLLDELKAVCNNTAGNTGSQNSVNESEYYTKLAELVSSNLVYRNTSLKNNDNSDRRFNVSNIKSASDFTKFVNTTICYTYQMNLTRKKWFAHYQSLSDPNSEIVYAKKIDEFRQELCKARKILNNAIFNTPEQEKYARSIISKISDITSSYVSFIWTVSKYECLNYDYHSKIYERYILGIGSTNESGMIHGETFDSNTLFDNEDIRDFNRTEWLDLNLTTECYELKYDIMETSKRIALQEAMILSDDRSNKFGRLLAMREAEEKKLGDGFMSIINRIKQFLEKFMQGITERSSNFVRSFNNSPHINKPIKIREIRSKGDIIAGMYRVQQKIGIIPFNYETMKDDLKDKRVFFEKRILPNMKNTSQYAKRKLEWNNDTSITDYCKVYYGASMPDENGKYPKCEFSTQDIEVNKNNIVKFLNQPSNAFSCKSDLDSLENESRKIAKSQPAQNNNSQATSAKQPEGNNTNTGSKNESMYYSELYNTWFTEADIEMGNQSENKDGNSNSNNSSSTNDEANAFKNYMECYKDIILAKMTAAEFIFAEMAQIINAHINSYTSSSNQNNTQNNNTTQTNK